MASALELAYTKRQIVGHAGNKIGEKKESLPFTVSEREDVELVMSVTICDASKTRAQFYGLVALKISSPLCVDFKLWIENDTGEKFGEQTVIGCEFNSFKKAQLFGLTNENDVQMYKKVLDSKSKSLTIYCKVVEHVQEKEAMPILKIQAKTKAYDVPMHYIESKIDLKSDLNTRIQKENGVNFLNLLEEDEVIEAFLNWLVNGSLSNSSVENVFYFAKDYGIFNLMGDCTDYMARWIDIETMPSRVVIVYTSGREPEKQLVWNFVKKNDLYAVFETSNEFACLKNANASIASDLLEWLKKQ